MTGAADRGTGAPRYVLLEHTTGPATGPAEPGFRPDVHWDLLLEASGEAGLVSFRLAENPLTLLAGGVNRSIRAAALPPHRAAYLDYEGPVSGGRGAVRRLDRGVVERLSREPGRTAFRLAVGKMAGVYEIVPDAAGLLVFQTVAP